MEWLNDIGFSKGRESGFAGMGEFERRHIAFSKYARAFGRPGRRGGETESQERG